MRRFFSFTNIIRYASCLALSLFLAGGAMADIIPDGYKHIPNELLFEGMDRFPDMTFALHRHRIGVTKGLEVKKGVNVRFYHLCQPNLYAFKAGTDLADTSVFEDPAVPRSNVKIEQVGLVPKSETASFIRRVYRITGISGNHIALQLLPDEILDASGKPIVKTALANLVGDPERTKKFFLAGAAGLFVLMVVMFTWVRGKRGPAPSAGGEG